MTFKPGDRVYIKDGGGFSDNKAPLPGTYLRSKLGHGFHRVLLDGVAPVANGGVGFPMDASEMEEL